MKRIGSSGIIVLVLILVAATTRIINAQMHLPNYAPLIALSVFGGAIIRDRKWLAFLVPVFGQLLADVYFSLFTQIPGFYNIAGMLFNYGGLLAATYLGTRMVMKPANALFTTLGGAVVFFIISNFGYFLQGWNGYSLLGLKTTYTQAIPFFKSSFEGNMVASVVLFGSWFLLHNAKTTRATVKA